MIKMGRFRSENFDEQKKESKRDKSHRKVGL